MELTPRTAGLIRILLDFKGVLWTEQSKCYKNITYDLNSGMRKRFTNLQKEERSYQTTTFWFQSTDWGLLVLYVYYLAGADRVLAGAGWWSQETEAGLQAGAGGGLDDSGELRTALPRAHWEETPSETELCLSEDLSPSFSIMWLPPAAFQRWLLPWPFFCFLLPKSILSFSSTLLHKLVYLKKNLKGGSGLRSLSSTVQRGGFLIFATGSASRGECLKGGHIGILRSPCRKKRGGKAFYVAFKNLHW